MNLYTERQLLINKVVKKLTEYKSNSHKSRAEKTANKDISEKNITKVVRGNAKTKENTARKFAGMFVSEDASNVKSYIMMDVLVPAIKKAVSDIVIDGIGMILYGKAKGDNRSRSNIISYRSCYDDRDYERGSRGRHDRDREENQNGRFDYEDIVFETRGDAEAVREQMLDTLDRYGMVTVADVYDLSGLTAPYTASKYGWFNIRTSEVTRVRDGYILKLPKAMPID